MSLIEYKTTVELKYIHGQFFQKHGIYVHIV
jgi:hypothetical protein